MGDDGGRADPHAFADGNRLAHRGGAVVRVTHMVERDQVHLRRYEGVVADADAAAIHEQAVPVDVHIASHLDVAAEVGAEWRVQPERGVNGMAHQLLEKLMGAFRRVISGVEFRAHLFGVLDDGGDCLIAGLGRGAGTPLRSRVSMSSACVLAIMLAMASSFRC